MDKYNENKDIILQRKKERYHAKKQRMKERKLQMLVIMKQTRND
jgi:hypothetical protein